MVPAAYAESQKRALAPPWGQCETWAGPVRLIGGGAHRARNPFISLMMRGMDMPRGWLSPEDGSTRSTGYYADRGPNAVSFPRVRPFPHLRNPEKECPPGTEYVKPATARRSRARGLSPHACSACRAAPDLSVLTPSALLLELTSSLLSLEGLTSTALESAPGRVRE